MANKPALRGFLDLQAVTSEVLSENGAQITLERRELVFSPREVLYIPPYVPPPPPPPLYGDEALALFAAMTVEPDATRKGLIDTCIADLIAGGVWAKLDFIYMLAAHDEQAAFLNWLNPGGPNTITKTGTVDFVVDRGHTAGTASGDRLNTQFTDTSVSKSMLDNTHFSVWVLNNVQSNNFGAPITGNNGHNSVRPFLTVNNYAINVQGITPQGASTDSRGFWMGVRADSSTSTAFKNNGTLASASGITTAPVGNAIYICGRNGFTSTRNQVAVATWGAALNAGERTVLYNALNAYLTAVGAV